MPPHPLASSVQRVLRAHEHLTNLKKLIADLVSENAESVVDYFKSKRLDNIDSTPEIQITISPAIPICIGEICYHLRTALEYMIFEIAKLDSGSPQDFTNFPIVDDKDKFRAWKKQARKQVINASHIAVIELLQPYKGCHWSGALRDISNKDKHREYPTIGIHAKFRLFRAAPHAPGTEIFRTKHPVTGEDVDVEIYFGSRVTFNNRVPVVETLDPGFARWIGPAGPKTAETLAKLPVPSFTRRVR